MLPAMKPARGERQKLLLNSYTTYVVYDIMGAIIEFLLDRKTGAQPVLSEIEQLIVEATAGDS